MLVHMCVHAHVCVRMCVCACTCVCACIVAYIQVHAVVAREFKNIIEDYNLMAADEESDEIIDEDMNEEPDI